MIKGIQDNRVTISQKSRQQQKRQMDQEIDETRNLTGQNLIQNPRFQQLKNKLNEYYIQSKQGQVTLHPNQSEQWKKVLYTSLHNLLTQVVLTQNKKVQQDIVNTTHQWYYKKVGFNAKSSWSQASLLRQSNRAIEGTSELEQYDTSKFDANSKRLQSASTARTGRPSTAGTFLVKNASRPSSAFDTGYLPFTGAGAPMQQQKVAWKNNYIYYNPTNSQSEKRLESKFLQIRQNQVEQRKQQVEAINYIQNWSRARSRQDEEFLRKIEGNNFASKYEKRGYQPQRPQSVVNTISRTKFIDCTQNPDDNHIFLDSGVSQEIYPSTVELKQQRIDSLRKTNCDLIETEENDPEDKRRKVKSLSVYSSNYNLPRPHSEQRFKTAGAQQRSYSANGIRKYQSGTQERKEQVQQLQNIKERLAKHKVVCSAPVIQNALVTPYDLPDKKLTWVQLPQSGCDLLSRIDTFTQSKGKKKRRKFARR